MRQPLTTIYRVSSAAIYAAVLFGSCASTSVCAQYERGSVQKGDLVPPPSSARESGASKEVFDLVIESKWLVDHDRGDEARKRLSEALQIAPNFAGIYNAIGYSYLKQDKFKQAETALRKGFSLDPASVEILDNLGSACYHQERFDDAITFYKQSLQQIQPNDPAASDTYVNLGSALAEKGELQEATDCFERAIKLKPDFPKTYNALARMYYNSGKYDLAAENARRAIAVKPDYAMAYYHLGLSEYALHHPDAAVEALKQSLKYETNKSYASDTRNFLSKLSGISASELNSGGPPAAAITSGLLPSAAPTFVPTGGTDAQRVSELLNHKQWIRAETLIKHMIDHSGENPILCNNLGYAIAHERSANSNQCYLKAITLYKRAIELQKTPFPTAYYNLGQAYRLTGDYSSAEAAFRHAIADAGPMRMSLPMAHNLLALLLKHRGDYKGANAEYKLALMQSGTELPVIHYNLALLLECMDRNKDAVREYRAYLKLSPTGLNVKQARYRLKRLS